MQELFQIENIDDVDFLTRKNISNISNLGLQSIRKLALQFRIFQSLNIPSRNNPPLKILHKIRPNIKCIQFLLFLF